MPKARDTIEHGSYGGYQAESKRGLPHCVACREANRQYQAKRRQTKEFADAAYVSQRRRDRARAELVRRHRTEYEEILAGISWLDTAASLKRFQHSARGDADA